MTVDSIKKSILDYIKDDRRQQAILLDGPWGCGKSHFVKNILIPAMEKMEEYQVHCISLYGMNDVATIQDAIYASWLEKVISENTGSAGTLISKGIGIFGKGFVRFAENKLGTDGSVTDGAKDMLGSFIGKDKKPIIVFDDLERCQIDIIEIMGFINNLVENNQYRILIVANEAEILNDDNDMLRALQYRIALSERILVPEIAVDKDNKNKNGIDIRELEARRERIFSKKTIYDRTREKLIGLTVPYSVKMETVYDEILKGIIKNEQTKDYILRYKSLIISTFEDDDNRNLRTLISAFIGIDEIVSVVINEKIIEGDLSDYAEEELSVIIRYVIVTAIKRSKGIELFKWPSGSRYGKTNGGAYGIVKNPIYGYAFIDEYWNTLVLDHDIVKKDITNQLVNKKNLIEMKNKDKEHQSLALNMLREWYMLPDESVKKYIALMKDELREKKYYPQEFKDIIHILMCINNPEFGMHPERDDNNDKGGIIYDVFDMQLLPDDIIEEKKLVEEYNNWETVEISEYVDLMYEYFNDNYEITKEMLRVISENRQFVVEYKIYFKKIIEEIEKREIDKIKESEEGKGTIVEMQWDDDFLSYCHNKKNQFMDNGRFLSLFDYVVLEDKLRHSTALQISTLCDALRTVYSFSNLWDVFGADYTVLHQTKLFVEKGDGLNNQKERTLAIALIRLLSDLKKYDNALSKVVE